ncbi:MAG: hypothetical protein KGH93_03390 [Patescibacteria group bacterium]|nr:HAMP domain-containing histidine kinase [Patescibacteria group bacterium]MDE1946209.1 hypothetical protein [Patescibacteria group bacterium]
MFNISTWSISIIVFSSLMLGLIAILRKPGEKASRLFLFMTLALAIWQLSNFLENEPISLRITSFFLQLDFASAVWVGYFWFIFVLNFSEKKILRSRFLKIILFCLPVFLSVCSFTQSIITDIHLHAGTIAFANAYLWPVYAVVVLGFFAAGYIVVVSNIIQSHGSLKMQNIYILVGMLISSGIALVVNLFLSDVLDANQSRIGIYGMIIFVFCAFYAIIRYHLFNIKIIETEIFTFVLWVVLLFRIFLSDNAKDVVTNSVIFGAVLLIGILLVKSVEEEVKLQESLQAANAGQTNLIHIMNHQIKGYLGKDKDIFAELLDGDYGNVVTDGVRDLIQMGLKETDAGVQYVTDILRGASAENGTLPYDMQPVDVRKIAAIAAENARPKAEERKLKFDFTADDGNYAMTGDPVQLAEAFRNLIENAVFYTFSGGITIRLSKNPGHIRFSVADTGIGVKPEDAPKLFKAGGVGSDSLKVNVKSSGYGLAFVKGVIEAHKGKVGFESAGEGKGTTFFVDLPAA